MGPLAWLDGWNYNGDSGREKDQSVLTPPLGSAQHSFATFDAFVPSHCGCASTPRAHGHPPAFADASLKTYVRPLRWEWPYVVRSGERVDQAVTVRVEHGPNAAAAVAMAQTIEQHVDVVVDTAADVGSTLPRWGVGVPAEAGCPSLWGMFAGFEVRRIHCPSPPSHRRGFPAAPTPPG